MSGAPTFSLREVAFRAGVAVSSASRVLSGHPDVSPAMRTRVMAVVEELGYEPNLIASSLRRGATMSVALVVGDVASPFAAATAAGAEAHLREAGYTLSLASSEGSAEGDAALISLFRRRRADGLLLALSHESDPATTAEIGRLQAPYVLIDGDLPGAPDASAVLCDHAGGIERAAEHLRGLGHLRVALVAGAPRPRPSRELRRGFEAACARLGMQPAVASGEWGGEEATARLLSASPRPTALVAGSGELLPGALRAIGALGLRIPADLSLVAFDDMPLPEVAQPSLATVSREPRAAGREAARLLLRRIAGEPPAIALVPARFDAGESCGPAPP